MNCSVLELVVWQEEFTRYSNVGGKHCKLKCFGQVVWQEGLNYCFNMCRKHCNLQCFEPICLARRLELLLQHV